ncbi:MAG: phytanoyl-CoA dioxygenase family protein [Bacteriovoracaceae bacterium]|nr:phytanoyl-CoA dioxygenase family protein [Bacteriovoracaceae bacterium]
MKDGYKLVKNFLNEPQICELEKCLNRVHENWCKENSSFYHKKAINSAYLTDPKNMSSNERMQIFNLITSPKINEQLLEIFQKDSVRFLNTQLFFDPVNKAQKNYWHRDLQYTQLPLEVQKEEVEMKVNNVVHFRIPLKDEPGIELIPGTNHRWDSQEELEVRTQLNKRESFHDLPGSKVIKLERGDLLMFSANMIHRGIYGNNRLALDILFCENDPEILKYLKKSCLPTKDELLELENKSLFI